MKFNKDNFLFATAVFIAAVSTATQAEIILHGTRVIYPSDAREVTLQLSNNGSSPSLVQTWIDEGDPESTPDQSKVPFMITPPISRVEGSRSQTLRITALPDASHFDQKQETVLWLNVLDIPPKPSANDTTTSPDNFLQLAIRSRVKFFYRPSSIKDDVNVVADKLQWAKSGDKLMIKNPSPFHVTLTAIYQKEGTKQLDLLPQGLMLKPFSTETVALQSNNINEMSFIHINDYGGRIEHKIQLQ